MTSISTRLAAVLLPILFAAAPAGAATATTATAHHPAPAPVPAPVPSRPDIGWSLALDRSVPGKGGWTTCYEYATGLQKKFSQAGGESHVVIYNWTQAESGSRGCHAFLVYRDAAGQYWGSDALSDRPRWLRGSTPPEWALFWDSDKTAVQVIADLTDKKLKGRWANRPKA